MVINPKARPFDQYQYSVPCGASHPAQATAILPVQREIQGKQSFTRPGSFEPHEAMLNLSPEDKFFKSITVANVSRSILGGHVR